MSQQARKPEHQNDLLGDESYSSDLLDHLPDDTPEARGKWPKDLVALCDIYAQELASLGIEEQQARKISLRLLMAQANYGGGRVFYLPKGDAIRRAVRDHNIWTEFNGRNHQELARQHNLTVPRVYNILAEQKALHVSRNQPQLF